MPPISVVYASEMRAFRYKKQHTHPSLKFKTVWNRTGGGRVLLHKKRLAGSNMYACVFISSTNLLTCHRGDSIVGFHGLCFVTSCCPCSIDTCCKCRQQLSLSLVVHGKRVSRCNCKIALMASSEKRCVAPRCTCDVDSVGPQTPGTNSGQVSYILLCLLYWYL